MGCHSLLQETSRPRDWTHVTCIAGRFLPSEHRGSPWHLPQEVPNLYLHKKQHTNIYNTFIQNFQNLEATRMFFRIDKQWINKLQYIQRMEWFSKVSRHEKTWKDPTWVLLLLLLSHFSRVRLCATPSLGFSRRKHWSGLPFPSPMHTNEKWKWSHSVISDSSRPHGLQPTRLLRPWDFPGESTGVGCHCLLWHP